MYSYFSLIGSVVVKAHFKELYLVRQNGNRLLQLEKNTIGTNRRMNILNYINGSLITKK